MWFDEEEEVGLRVYLAGERGVRAFPTKGEISNSPNRKTTEGDVARSRVAESTHERRHPT